MHFLPITLPLYTSVKCQRCLVWWRKAAGTIWKVFSCICRAIVVLGVYQFDAVPNCRIWNQWLETRVWLDRKNTFQQSSEWSHLKRLPVAEDVWAYAGWTPVKVSWEEDWFLPSPPALILVEISRQSSLGLAFYVCEETRDVSRTQKENWGELVGLGKRKSTFLWPQGDILRLFWSS